MLEFFLFEELSDAKWRLNRGVNVWLSQSGWCTEYCTSPGYPGTTEVASNLVSELRCLFRIIRRHWVIGSWHSPLHREQLMFVLPRKDAFGGLC
jgi:hypothetical protein